MLGIDLYPYIHSLYGARYCIIKLADAEPFSRKGADLDIFCADLADVAERLHQTALSLPIPECELIATKVSDVQWHYDIFLKGELQFRFDLYGDMPDFHRVKVKRALFDVVLESAIERTLEIEGKPVTCFVPAAIDDLVIRYLEYCEYYSLEAKKLKHLQWIEECLLSEAERGRFFARLHHYTSLPQFSELDVMRAERDALKDERDKLRAERDALKSERDGLRAERDALKNERDSCAPSATH